MSGLYPRGGATLAVALTLVGFCVSAQDPADGVADEPTRGGERAYHVSYTYDVASGQLERQLNKEDLSEHATLGTLANGHDASFTVAGLDNGYPYARAATHLSALAHAAPAKWLAVSSIGEVDGSDVYRVGHHRTDEEDFPNAVEDVYEADYWAEPHVVISPTATRLLFASDWSEPEDGKSIDSYVVELPAYSSAALPADLTGFAAEPDGDDVLATWTTTSEVDVNHFEVELGSVTGGTVSAFAKTVSAPARGPGDYRALAPVVLPSKSSTRRAAGSSSANSANARSPPGRGPRAST